MALRSRPDVDQFEWIGEVALLRDESQPNARILAEQLSSQPEVELRRTELLRRKHATPNDPSYARQWNFNGINMPGPRGTSRRRRERSHHRHRRHRRHRRSAAEPLRPHLERPAIVTTTPPSRPALISAAGRFVSPRDFTVVRAEQLVVDTDGHGTHVACDHRRGDQQQPGACRHRLQRAHHAGQSVRKLLGHAVCDVGRWHPGIRAARRRRCPTSDIVAGIRYAADNGAKVINFSLGGTCRSQSELRRAELRGQPRRVHVHLERQRLRGRQPACPIRRRLRAAIDGAMSVAAIDRSRGACVLLEHWTAHRNQRAGRRFA